MRTFRLKPRAWLMPPLSLYWRRRRRPLRAAGRPLAAAATASLAAGALPSTPMTLVSIHQHVHHSRHAASLLSRTSAVTWRLPPPGAALPTVSTRVVVKRLIEARPFDGAGSLAPALQLTSRAAAAPPRTLARQRHFPIMAARHAPFSPIGVPPVPQDDVRLATRRSTTVERPRRLLTERTLATTNERTHTIVSHQDRPADLLRLDWRRPRTGTGAEVSAAGPAPAGPNATRIGAPPAPPAHTASAELSIPFASRPAPAALAVDAATVDRLADTVLQRIERRARIERERRGL